MLLSREMIVESIREVGVGCEVSDIYGKDTVLKLMLDPNYYLYTAISTIQPCFWHIAGSVIAEMEKKVDFALAFIDALEEKIYIYDSKQALILLQNASVEQKSKNYRLTSKDVQNPLSLSTFCEFVDSLK